MASRGRRGRSGVGLVGWYIEPLWAVGLGFARSGDAAVGQKYHRTRLTPLGFPLGFYRGGRGPGWLDLELALSMLGRSRPAATRAYRRLMRELAEELYEDLSSWGQAVRGDEKFADRVLQAAGELPFIPRGLTVEKLARSIALEEGLELGTMRGQSRKRAVSRARLMVAWLGREVGRISVAQTARFFGRDTSVMIKGLNRLEAAMKQDRGLRGKLALLEAEAEKSHEAMRQTDPDDLHWRERPSLCTKAGHQPAAIGHQVSRIETQDLVVKTGHPAVGSEADVGEVVDTKFLLREDERLLPHVVCAAMPEEDVIVRRCYDPAEVGKWEHSGDFSLRFGLCGRR